MISKELIDRINELAAKAKTEEGLTEEEIAERDGLRQKYIQAIRARVKEQLDNIEIVDDLPEEPAKEN